MPSPSLLTNVMLEVMGRCIDYRKGR
ncbi:gp126 [Brochothrix phage A9]|uniref:Gp126 n=1 Tax=Brochothrix phage A9 TaxID=857312 RepID=D9J0S3_9CAUD|nr:gp126 [Brochothrix phage A9]ADJ53160.1 gp126 [Brochothrix phage A9]